MLGGCVFCAFLCVFACFLQRSESPYDVLQTVEPVVFVSRALTPRTSDVSVSTHASPKQQQQQQQQQQRTRGRTFMGPVPPPLDPLAYTPPSSGSRAQSPRALASGALVPRSTGYPLAATSSPSSRMASAVRSPTASASVKVDTGPTSRARFLQAESRRTSGQQAGDRRLSPRVTAGSTLSGAANGPSTAAVAAAVVATRALQASSRRTTTAAAAPSSPRASRR
jgi:hypothetical protein